MLRGSRWARKKKTPVAAGVFPLFRDPSEEESRRNKHAESLAQMGYGCPERRHWRLRCRRRRFPFFIRATAGAVSTRLPSAAAATAATATAHAVAVRRLGASSERLPRPAIRKRLTGVRIMPATSASTGLVAERVP